MGTYNIPRNLKGETRLLYIFSIKSLITTAAGALIGSIFYLLFSTMGFKTVGVVFLAIFALIGFGVGVIKIPNISGIAFTKKVAGDSIDEVVLRYIKFNKNRKIYVDTKEEK